MKSTALRQRFSGKMFPLIFLAAFPLWFCGCGSSASSYEEIEDPTGMPAIFALSHIENEMTGDVEVAAGAIFKGEALTTVRLLNGDVELEDPQGNIHPLELQYNPSGAPYYSVELLEGLDLGGFYTFRVTLPNGRLTTNTIKAPEQDLEILEPARGEAIETSQPLEVRWTGRSHRRVSILVGPETPDIFNFLEIGGANTDDDGSSFLDPESLVRVHPGDNLLSMIRYTSAHANGFHNSSRVGAVLLTSRPIKIQ